MGVGLDSQNKLIESGKTIKSFILVFNGVSG